MLGKKIEKDRRATKAKSRMSGPMLKDRREATKGGWRDLYRKHDGPDKDYYSKRKSR